ncbi:hypothetical protein ACKQTC_08510 [Peptococcus simiae]|uniref:Uncharacterized protein n=1 Tax=Peptococcus simiae TaxID=1643805 RepID=A0ABW9H2H0_9FIRM
MSKEIAKKVANEIADWLGEPGIYEGIEECFILLTVGTDEDGDMVIRHNVSCDTNFAINAVTFLIGVISDNNPEAIPFLLEHVTKDFSDEKSAH